MEAIMLMLKHIILTMLALIVLAAIVAALGCGRQKDKDDGEPQEECSVSKAEGTATITCSDGSTATIEDGRNGDTGSNGATGSPGAKGDSGRDAGSIYVVLPCPQIVGANPELLFCIGNSLYLIFDTHSKEAHLSAIGPGSYTTTDGRSCHFTVIAGCVIQ